MFFHIYFKSIVHDFLDSITSSISSIHKVLKDILLL